MYLRSKITRTLCSRDPIGKDAQGLVSPGIIVTGKVYLEIMHSIHAGMHHEFHFESGRLSRFKGHRTDGRGGWSASLDDFNVRRLGKTQGLVTNIG